MRRRRCPHCGETFEVYEPIRVVLADGTERHGSAILSKRPGASPCTSSATAPGGQSAAKVTRHRSKDDRTHRERGRDDRARRAGL